MYMSDELKEFINRCNTTLKNDIDQQFLDAKKRNNWVCNGWIRRNREEHRKMILKYSKTEKGKLAIKRRDATRTRRFREMSKDLTKDELQEVKQFYENCPPLMHVDHIIPLCKGGKHHISNLQYLTPQENWEKGSTT